MALTYSSTLEKKFLCPNFQLPSVDGKMIGMDYFSKSQILVVLFICNHCPYVKAIEDRLLNLQKKYSPDQVQLVAICSNDSTEYPEDSPDALFSRWKEKKYPFPYLIDESQQVAKSFHAVCTPDIYAFDKKRSLFYRGRLDDSWKNPQHVNHEELKQALDEVLEKGTYSGEIIPSMGCSIKWKS